METENIYVIENNKIIYGNTLIAVYDGFVINEAGLYEDKSGQYRPSKTVGLLYHESWEALMPVLKKIAAVDDIYCAGICAIIRKHNFEILAIWEAVVKHIEFINRKNNEQNS